MATVTKTLKASLGDYSLMSTWQSTEVTNLVSDGDSHVLECDAFTCSDSATIAGWGTDATHTLTIKAASGHEHNGVRGAGFILTSTAGSTLVGSDQDYLFIEDIEVINTSATTNRRALRTSGTEGNASNQTWKRIIGESTATSSASALFNTVTIATIENCLGIGESGIYTNRVIPCNNCTFISTQSYSMVIDVSNALATNVLAFGAGTTDFFALSGSFAAGCTNNAASDTSTPGSNPQDSVASTVFTNYAGGDYSLSGTGAVIGGGSDLSGTFTDDIANATRSSWDIGAYEYIAPGWSITNVDLDDTIVDAQTGVVVAISGTVSATGKTVWLKQGANWVEQTVTAQDASSVTITVTYGGVLSAGAATLYVRNPL